MLLRFKATHIQPR